MDHYTVFPQDGMAAITEFGPQFDPNEQYLASAYELADHNFQPVIAPTQPNVLTALNGTDHGWVYNNLEPGPTPAVELHLRRADRARPHAGRSTTRCRPSALTGTVWHAAHPARARRGPDHRVGRSSADLAAGALPDSPSCGPASATAPSRAEDIGRGRRLDRAAGERGRAQQVLGLDGHLRHLRRERRLLGPRGARGQHRLRGPDPDDHHQPVRAARRVPPADDQRLDPVVHAEAVGPARADPAQRRGRTTCSPRSTSARRRWRRPRCRSRRPTRSASTARAAS